MPLFSFKNVKAAAALQLTATACIELPKLVKSDLLSEGEGEVI